MSSADAPFVEALGVVGGAPGQPAMLQLRLRNDAATDRVLVVSVLGLDSEWLPGPVRTAPLAAGEYTELTVVITPSAGTPPGSYGFVVAVQPVDPQSGRAAGSITQIESTVVVGDPAQLSLEVSPPDPEAVRTRRVDVRLANRGTTPLSVTLTTTASAGLKFTVRRREVQLPPGGTEKVRGRLTAQDRRWFGQKRRLPFILTAQGHTTPVRVDGVFVAHPVLTRSMSRALALVAVIAVWAAAGLFAVNAISRHAHNVQTADASGALIGGSANGTGNGNGSGSGGSGSGAGGGSAGGHHGKKSSGSASAPSRLNGTVTGSSPGGVNVTLSTTSLVDEQPAHTTFVNTASQSGVVGKLSSSTMDLTSARTAPAVQRTRTASDGSFAFAGVKSPGYYLVTLTKPGYQSHSLVVSANPGQPLPTLKVPMQAGAGKVSGTVTGPNGKALPTGAHVTVVGGTLTLATNTATTGAHRGHWLVDGLSTPGTYVVSASADGYGTATALVTLGASGQAVRNISLTSGVESIEGSISFGTNQPLGGATVTATNGTVTRTATSLTTGTPGFYSLPNLPIGSKYTVTVSSAGFATQTFQVDLDGSKSVVMQDATMTSSTAIVSGSVIDGKTGEAVDSAGLILASDNATYKIVSRAGTGQFTFDGVVPGNYTLTVEAFAYEADFLNVTVHAGDVTTLPTVSLTPDESGGIPATSSITGHVVDAHTGAALHCPTTGGTGCRIEVTVTPPPGQPALAPIHVGADQPYTVPGPDETDPAYAKGLPPGLYKLTFQFPGYEPNTLAVAVPESTVVSAVPVALTPDGTILGHLTTTTADLNGCVIAVPFDPANPGKATPVPTGVNCGTQPSAAAGASGVTPCSVDPGVCIGQIDSNGDYEIDFVPHGTYWVYIRTEKAGSHDLDTRFVPLQPVQLTVEAGQSRRYDAVLNQLGTVDVLVNEPTPSGDPGIIASGLPVTLKNQENGTVLGTQPTGGDGVAHFADVPTGTYVACSADPATTSSAPADCPVPGALSTALVGTTDPFQVSVNQNVKVPLVLSKGTGAVIGQIYSLVDNTKHYIGGAKILVTGITGYNGQVAKNTTFTVTTNSDGCFAVGTVTTAPNGCSSLTGSAVTAGSFVVTPDTITVDTTSDPAFDRYGVKVVRDIAFSTDGSATGIALDAPPTPVTGNVTVHPSVNGAQPNQVSLLATQLAPGAGNVTLSASYSGTPTSGTDATGTLVWKDSSLVGSPANSAVPGGYQVRASLDGYDDTTASNLDVPLYTSSAALAAAGSGTGVYALPDIVLDAHGSLEFVAEDPTNQPVDGATFTLESAQSPATIAPVTITAGPTDDSVTFPDLSKAAGPYQVVIRAAGFPKTTSGSVAVDPGKTVTTTVLLTNLGTLTGKVSAELVAGDGHPFALSGAKVVASNGTGTFTTVTDVDGNYSLTGTAANPGLVPGTDWDIKITAFGYDTFEDTTATITAGTDTLNQTLTATKISNVTILVQDDKATPAPVPGAKVVLQNSAVSGLVCNSAGTTDSSGDCLFTNVPPTTYNVTVTAAGFAPLSTTIALRVGVDPQSFTLTLASRGNTINGQVTGRNLDGSTFTDWSTPSLNFDVTLETSGTTTGWTGTVTAATGEFNFPNLPDGTYDLKASATGYGIVDQSVKVAGGQAAFVNLTLNAAAAQVTVNVTSSLSGVSMSGATVALNANATPNGAQDQGTQTAVAGSGSNTATAVFNQVPPGTYDIVVVGPAGQLGKTVTGQAITSGADTVNVTIDEALLNVTVTSVHGASTPAPTATLTIGPTSGSTLFTGSVPANGSTTSVYVPAAADGSSTNYTASAKLADGSGWVANPVSASVDLNHTSTQSLTLTFVQIASLTVTVVDKTGATVFGSTVSLVPTVAGTYSSADGTWTFTNLDTSTRYEVDAQVTTGSGSSATTLQGKLKNVTVQPGSNSVSVTVN